MPKGRNFAPSPASDGIWFQHRGLPDPGIPSRDSHTSTGLMLSGPFDPNVTALQKLPPQPYLQKNSRNFKLSNNFSNHDNRHSFQDHGVYFGNGEDSRLLGKRLTVPPERQHFTEKEYLKHRGRVPVNFELDTVYSSEYLGQPTSAPPTRRRFPRIHREGAPGTAKLDTTTTDWFREPDVPFRTPLHVLAVSQEPFLPPNHFKYSYSGRPKCYPPYNRGGDRLLPYPSWTLQDQATIAKPSNVPETVSIN